MKTRIIGGLNKTTRTSDEIYEMLTEPFFFSRRPPAIIACYNGQRGPITSSGYPRYFLLSYHNVLDIIMADKFDEATQKELSRFLEAEQAQVHLTPCFKSPYWSLFFLQGQNAFNDTQSDRNMLGQVRSRLRGNCACNHRRCRCVSGTPSTKFSRSEESCLSNCVGRFLDTSMFLVKKIEEQRQTARDQFTQEAA